MPHVSKGDIHAYLDGALGAYPEDEATRIRAHLEECQECAEALAEERDLRRVASEILAATAQAPVDLDPFEELVARAGEAEPSRPAGRASRFRVLRMAATVVVSLGAGWLARDLTTPARDLATGPTLDAVRAQDAVASRTNEDVAQEEDEPDAAASLIRLEVTAEDESVERQAAVSDFAIQPQAPEESRDLDAPAVAQMAPAAAPSRPAEQAEVGRRDVVGGELRLDRQRELERQAEPAQARRRLEAIAPAGVAGAADNRAAGAPAREVAPTALADELSKTDPQDLFANEANAEAFDDMSITARTSSFVIPGLPVRDVRLSALTEGLEPSVTVIQELPDGRTLELRFVAVARGGAADDAASARKDSKGVPSGRELEERDALEEAQWLFGESIPEGWSQVGRAVQGGVAILRGPLSEAELSALLDEAVAGR